MENARVYFTEHDNPFVTNEVNRLMNFHSLYVPRYDSLCDTELWIYESDNKVIKTKELIKPGQKVVIMHRINGHDDTYAYYPYLVKDAVVLPKSVLAKLSHDYSTSAQRQGKEIEKIRDEADAAVQKIQEEAKKKEAALKYPKIEELVRQHLASR